MMLGDIAAANTAVLRHSELLCFVNDKSNSMAFDDIVKLCTDFYREDEIISAREILDDCNPGQRMPKRKGNERLRATMEDIVKAVLKQNEQNGGLPIFYAVDISRLPPVDANHCDVAAILKELSALRNEVRAVSKLREEVTQLRTLLQLQGGGMGKENTYDINSLNSGTTQVPSVSDLKSHTKPLFADMAAILSLEGGMKNTVVNKKVPRKPTIGNSSSISYIKAVKTTRNVDIFVSRLLPTTTAAELVDSVHSIKPDITVHEVTCNKLTSRYRELYSSYHVAIKVNADDMKKAIDTFMSPESWPVGVIVRRYFRPKSINNGSQSESESNII